VTQGVRVERFIAAADDAGTRLDVFLSRRLPALSRSRLQKLITAGHVHVDGAIAKNSLALHAGASVEVSHPPNAPSGVVPEALPLVVVYDDDDLAVIDKPAGMVVHPAAGHRTGTVVNALLHHLEGLSGIGGADRPGIVHRLDRGTSGLMVVAKHDAAHQHLSRQFHDRLVTKQYLALVWGAPRQGEVIDRPIGRDPRERKKMSTRASRGRTAVTRVVDVERIGDASLVRVAIGTGRTHQIRVHLSESGHPIVGDALYGGVRRRIPQKMSVVGTLGRLFLHAARLEFAHPRDGRRLAFEAPLPDDLARVVDTLRAAASSS
jgi:23S rRNA pseudouridine1911/1915/1917 synthase